MRIVRLIDNDISDKVTQVSNIVETAGDIGQLSQTDLVTIDCDNRNGYFDPQSPSSPFYREADYGRFYATIENDGIITFEGSVNTIRANNQTEISTVELKSDIQKILDLGLVYASADESNPAIIVQEICELYDIPYNSPSISTSSSTYNVDNIIMTAFFKGESTILNALQQIAEIGVGRVFFYRGELYFEVYRDKNSAPVYTFSDEIDNPDGITVLTDPIVENLEKTPITGYKIEYVGGMGALAAVKGTTTQQGKTISAGYSSPVRIMDIQSAVWIGEKWESYLSTQQSYVTFQTQSRYGKSLEVGFPIALIYEGRDFGTMDISSIDNSTKGVSTVRALTR